MKTRSTIKAAKMFIALLLIGGTHIAMGSFTGSSEGRNRQFSLKDFNRSLYKTTANPFSLKAGFEFKGTQVLQKSKDANGNTTLTSIMRFEKGNTTYIYPYKHKVSVAKFATPTPPPVR